MRPGTFQDGPKHRPWRGGRYVNECGYIRFSAGPHRNKYEHRVVVEETIGGPIPTGWDGQVEFAWEVHHMDFNRRHNCQCNLLLIDERLHRPAAVARKYNGRVRA